MTQMHDCNSHVPASLCPTSSRAVRYPGTAEGTSTPKVLVFNIAIRKRGRKCCTDTRLMKYSPACLLLPISPLDRSHCSGSESKTESGGRQHCPEDKTLSQDLSSSGYILASSTDFSSHSQAVCISPQLSALTGWTRTLFLPYKRCIREFWCKDSTYSRAEAAKRSSDVLPLECRLRI